MRTPIYRDRFPSVRAPATQRLGVALSGLLGASGCSLTLDLQERVCSHDAHCSVDGSSVCIEGTCSVPDAGEGPSGGDTTTGVTSSESGAGSETTSGSTGTVSAPNDDDSTGGEEDSTGGPDDTSSSTSSSTSTTSGDDTTSEGEETSDTCSEGDCSPTEGNGESTSGPDASESDDEPEPIPPLITNGDFEVNTFGWTLTNPSSAVVLTRTEEVAYRGSYSMLVSGRSENWEGTMVNISQTVREGVYYSVSAWLRLREELPGASMSMTAKLTCLGQDEAFDWIADTAVWHGDWTQVTGLFYIAEGCRPRNVFIYFEGAHDGTTFYDYYIDDVSAEVVY